MADNTPTRLGQINNAGDTQALFLKFYAETLGAFRRKTAFMDRHYVRNITSGKSAQFPLIGRAGSYYHVPGTEITGSSIPQNERVLNIDGILISPVSIADIDEMLNHYEVRREFTAALGEALALAFDQNVARTGILTARSAAWHASMPGGTAIIQATAKTDAAVMAAAIYAAGVALDENFVPEEGRSAFLKPLQYALLAQSTTIQNKDIGGAGAYLKGTVPEVNSIELVKATNLPTTAVTGTYNNKYDVDATNTAALVMHRTAVGTVKRQDISVKSEYSLRRLGTLILAMMLVGHGGLRPEAAAEIKTA
ncbi:major capsid protein [Rhizobium phage RHph_I20]|uniref:Major capsid protein n=1 Tax=Rhizobium phage RHph_I20 TaxID=2509730 RepID=A0A7S5RK04_9CAUD|nr:major capsid protein [Rhizobium phage RHph_I20]